MKRLIAGMIVGLVALVSINVVQAEETKEQLVVGKTYHYVDYQTSKLSRGLESENVWKNKWPTIPSWRCSGYFCILIT